MGNVAPEQMSNATPCDKWTVHDLCNHIVGGGHMFAAAFRGEQQAIDPDADMPDMVGPDPLASFDASIADFNAAIDSPGAMDKVISLPFGEIPAPVVLEILKFDLLVHAWDIAKATDQQFSPPDELVLGGLEAAKMIIAPEARDGDTFKQEVTAAPSVTPIERLAAFTGRSI